MCMKVNGMGLTAQIDCVFSPTFVHEKLPEYLIKQHPASPLRRCLCLDHCDNSL